MRSQPGIEVAVLRSHLSMWFPSEHVAPESVPLSAVWCDLPEVWERVGLL